MTIRPNAFSRLRKLLLLAGALLTAAASYAQPQPPAPDTDPPARVGRISYLQGEVSFSPAGNDEWVHARLNRPIVTGDRLWADNNARAELSINDSTWWFGEQTSVTVANLDDRIVQFQLQQGTIDVRVRGLPAGNIVEIDTPTLAFSLTRPGRYRVEVDPQDGTTSVIARNGSGEVYGEGASYVVDSGQGYRFYGTDLADSEYFALPHPDAFDDWVAERDRRYDRGVSVRYVSPEVVGYEDLDGYGSWSAVADYGNVWFPRAVHAGWAPYREGHWAWIDPWGWTWVDDQPWGFAPFHYGRWAYFDRGWGWVPGPRSVRPVYAPALVAFVGGAGFGIAVSSGPAIGWFPLGPREVYVPPYSVSRNYFRQVNVSNTVINNTTIINNYYNNPTQLTQVNYVNRRAPNAVTAVAPAAFAQGQNVTRAAVAVPAAEVQRAQVHPVAAVAPARTAFLGAAPVAQARPPAATAQRAVVAKMQPPPPPIPDAQKIQALEKNPGRPLSRTELQSLRRESAPAAAPTARPAVKVVDQAKPAPHAAPPARAAGAAGARRTAGAAAPSAGTPPAATPPGPGTPPAATPPAAQAPEPKGPPGARGAAAGPEAKGPPGARDRQSTEPEVKGPAVARPPEGQGGGGRRGAPPGQERAPAAVPTPPANATPGAPAEPARARGPAERRPAEPATSDRAAPAGPPGAQLPESRGAEPRTQRGRPEGTPSGQVARPPESRPAPSTQMPRGPEERSAPQRPPEARPQPRAPETRPAPQRAPDERAQPQQQRPQPQRPPEAGPQPQRQPEARPQPQRPPEAQRPPQTPQQPQRPPEAQRPPQAPQQPAEARGGPPGRQPERPQPQKGKEGKEGKDNDKKNENP